MAVKSKPRIIPTPVFVKYGPEVPISGRDGTVKVAIGKRPGRFVSGARGGGRLQI